MANTKSTGRGSSSTRKSSGNRSGRSTSGKNTSRAPRKSTKAYERQREAERAEAKTPPENLLEIYVIICFAINLILVLGTYGVCGKVGLAVSGFFFGIVGATFYAMPFAIFIMYVFLLVNGPKPKLIKKIIWFTVLFMVAGFIMQLSAAPEGMGIKELYMLGYKEHSGGGIIFGGLLTAIVKYIGKAGGIIITILLAIISLIEITNIKIFNILKNLVDFSAVAGRTGYDDYDDEEEYDYQVQYSEKAARTAKEAKLRAERAAMENAILNDIRVLDQDGKTIASKKKKDRSKTNKIVQDEEVHELIPDVPISGTRTATPTKGFIPESKNGPLLPGEERPRNDVGNEGNALLDEINSASQLYNQSKGGRPASDYKPKDFFELEPDDKTYDDPLGSGTYYNDDSGKVSASYKGPHVRSRNDQASPDIQKITGKAPQAEESETQKVTKEDKENATREISEEIQNNEEKKKEYKIPPMKLLKSGGRSATNRTGDQNVRETAVTLKSTLESFGVNVTITNCSVGPAITQYELQPEQGVRVNRILSLENDIKLALAASDIRIEAPIPGKSSIGVEIPNKEKQAVFFRDLIDNDLFERFKSNLAFAVGKDISGQIIIADVAKMPHLLVAGQTGSGKSVCINTLIMSILYKSSPEDVKMIMIDPKMVELAVYNGIPHLMIPVVTDPKKAAGALNWAVEEMTKRYQLFSNYNVRNIEGFNKKFKAEGPNDDPAFRHLPQILVIVDELADLMMVAHKEVEDSIVRLSQLARAAGIHLVIATQRPSVDVITGLIKANVPSRIAFSVASAVDSRTIIDSGGAEKLLGKGDMLFYPTGYNKPVRVQGAFISDDEVQNVVDFIKKSWGESSYDENIAKSIESSDVGGSSGGGAGDDSGSGDSRYDEYFEDAARFVIEKDKASIGYLQRMLRIGFNRAARIMDQLEEFGVVGPEEGTKPRRILMSISDFEEALSGGGE